MKLTRVYPGEDGKCSYPPGSYGLERGEWYLSLDWEKEPDGEAREKTVHDFIERGEWREC